MLIRKTEPLFCAKEIQMLKNSENFSTFRCLNPITKNSYHYYTIGARNSWYTNVIKLEDGIFTAKCRDIEETLSSNILMYNE